MQRVDGWVPGTEVELVVSKGGVLVAADPFSNLIRANTSPWPPPELVWKLHASNKFQGRTEADHQAARVVLGHYCDLQSLSSEDAVTWSLIGPVAYSGVSGRLDFAGRLFERIRLPQPKTVAIWLWRRLAHPEKPHSQSGPEIDFGILSESCLVLGEAKWNSKLGTGQGLLKDRTQQDLRCAYCEGLARKAFPGVSEFCILGVGRKPDVLDCTLSSSVGLRNVTWGEVADCLPDTLRSEANLYLAWKAKYSK